VDETEYHKAVRHFYLEAEAEEVYSMLTELAIFVAAFAVAFFSFAVAVAVAVAADAAVAKVRLAVAVAFAGSPFFVGVVVVSGKVERCSFFEEFDLLVAVHPVRTWFRQLRSMDLTFVVWLRTMLHYYSL
jgi:hypothetical protein